MNVGGGIHFVWSVLVWWWGRRFMVTVGGMDGAVDGGERGVMKLSLGSR